VIIVDHSLKYLRESLSNYEEENNLLQNINLKLATNHYKSEIDFIEDLDEDELIYLDRILEQEMNYARDAQDEVRAKELNDIYELLI